MSAWCQPFLYARERRYGRVLGKVSNVSIVSALMFPGLAGRKVSNFSACLQSEANRACHLLSRFAQQPDPAPEPRAVRARGLKSLHFQGSRQGAPGEEKRFLLLLDPALIGLPELACATPGVRMLYTAGCYK